MNRSTQLGQWSMTGYGAKKINRKKNRKKQENMPYAICCHGNLRMNEGNCDSNNKARTLQILNHFSLIVSYQMLSPSLSHFRLLCLHSLSLSANHHVNRIVLRLKLAHDKTWCRWAVAWHMHNISIPLSGCLTAARRHHVIQNLWLNNHVFVFFYS